MADEPNCRFRILTIDGGGMRGLISALVIADLERRLRERSKDPEARIADFFHLVAGTSAGGLTSLALTAPNELSVEEVISFYSEDGPKIFRRGPLRWLLTLGGLIGPKYSTAPVREAIEKRIGDCRLKQATRDLLITSFDMTACTPYFFKRWRALESPERDFPLVDVGLSTAAAPTYFASHGGVPGRALVDGGVFANNPVIAAIAEALGRNSDPPAELEPADLFVSRSGPVISRPTSSNRGFAGGASWGGWRVAVRCRFWRR